ncbi:MFS transporter [Actinoplanes sp. CA-030573]|uniref:MFS transporter n=1 Tax=Actinoplanes sp. CA-030573 TaxID=3239898 RepID=UPI003D8D1AEB
MSPAPTCSCRSSSPSRPCWSASPPPFAGLVIDAIDRKRLLLAALVVYAAAGTAPLYLDSLGAIIGSRAVVGLCEAAIMTCCTTLIGDYWAGSRRSRYLGLQTLVATVAATVFLALGGGLGAAGWRTPFWLYLVALVLVVPMYRLIWQPVPSSGKLPPLPWRALLVPCLITLVGGVVFYALVVQLSFVLDGLGVTSSAAIGGVSAAMSIATAAGSASFAKLSSRRPRTLLPIAFGLAAAGLAIVFAAGNVALVTAGAMVTGLGTGLLLPVLLTWATNRLHFDQRGRGTGLWTGFLFVGEFASPLVVAAFKAASGDLQQALGVLAVVALALAVVALLVVPRSAPPLNVTD